MGKTAVGRIFDAAVLEGCTRCSWCSNFTAPVQAPQTLINYVHRSTACVHEKSGRIRIYRIYSSEGGRQWTPTYPLGMTMHCCCARLSTKQEYFHLSAAESTGSSDVVGGRGYLCAVDHHAEVVDRPTIVIGLPFGNRVRPN